MCQSTLTESSIYIHIFILVGPLDLSSLVLDSEKTYQEKVEAETKVFVLEIELLQSTSHLIPDDVHACVVDS